jgi:hypothetical protein
VAASDPGAASGGGASCSLVPQVMQNFASSAFSVWQDGQCINTSAIHS